MKRRSSGIRTCLTGLFCSAFMLFGQLQLSSIRGTLVDPSGATVAGAKIAVTDVKTNITARSMVSDGAGNFEMPDLVAGVYRLTAEAPGFKTFVADNLVLGGSQIRRLDIALEVGQVADRITVQAGVSPITTDSAHHDRQRPDHQRSEASALRREPNGPQLLPALASRNPAGGGEPGQRLEHEYQRSAALTSSSGHGRRD